MGIESNLIKGNKEKQESEEGNNPSSKIKAF